MCRRFPQKIFTIRHFFCISVKNIFKQLESNNKEALFLQDHPKTLRNKLLDALSDALFTAPLVRTARMHSTDEFRKTSNTFLYMIRNFLFIKFSRGGIVIFDENWWKGGKGGFHRKALFSHICG